jgi:repressor LexA
VIRLSEIKISKLQQSILDFIESEVKDKGYPPSVREIGEAVGLKSSSTVHGHLARLKKKNLIYTDPSKPRAIKILDNPDKNKGQSPTNLVTKTAEELSEQAKTNAAYFKNSASSKSNLFSTNLNEDIDFKLKVARVPLIGRVTAGAPILATENVEEFYPIPAHYVGDHNVFMLSVMGDSMIEAGILDGDYIIVRQQSTARNGEIVVAMTQDDEATVKRFYKESGHIRLQPENSSMDPIILKDVKILGKVVGLLRDI